MKLLQLLLLRSLLSSTDAQNERRERSRFARIFLEKKGKEKMYLCEVHFCGRISAGVLCRAFSPVYVHPRRKRQTSPHTCLSTAQIEEKVNQLEIQERARKRRRPEEVCACAEILLYLCRHVRLRVGTRADVWRDTRTGAFNYLPLRISFRCRQHERKKKPQRRASSAVYVHFQARKSRERERRERRRV